MPTKMSKGKIRDRYLELIQQFPLRHIGSLKELKAASAMLDKVLAIPARSAGEIEYFEALLDLIHTYEEKAYPPDDVSDADMLEHLLDAQGLTQAAFSRAVDIPTNVVNEILKGKRKLNRRHIEKIVKSLRISPGVFFPANR
jgi:HTH-type transcriptional regulator / antitoxin HigA